MRAAWCHGERAQATSQERPPGALSAVDPSSRPLQHSARLAPPSLVRGL